MVEKKAEPTRWLAALPPVFLFLLLWIPMEGKPFEPDSYELLMASRELGIGHPPGYSLYLSFTWLFIQLGGQLGWDAAFSLNLFSYLCGGASLLLLMALFQSSKAVLTSGLLLLACRGYWYSATVIEVYSLQLLLLLLLLHCLNRRWFLCSVFTASMLVVHHSFLLPVVILLGLASFAGYASRQDLFKGIGVFCITPVYHVFYLLWRGSLPDVFNVWASFETFKNVLWHSFALEFAQSFLTIPSLSDLMQILKILFFTVPVWFWLAGLIVYFLARRDIKRGFPREAMLYAVMAGVYFTQCSLYQIHDIWVYLFLVQFFLLLCWSRLLDELDFSEGLAKLVSFLILILFVLSFALIPVENPFDEHKVLRETILTQARRIDQKDAVFLARRFDFLFPLMEEQRAKGKERVLPSWVFKSPRYYEWYQQKFPKRFVYPDFLDLEKSLPGDLSEKIQKMDKSSQAIALEFARMAEFVSKNQEKHPFYFEVNEDLLWVFGERGEGYLNLGSWNQFMPQSSFNPILLVGLGAARAEGPGVEDRVYVRQGEQASLRIKRYNSGKIAPKMLFQCDQGMEGVQELSFPPGQDWIVLTLTNPLTSPGVVRCTINSWENPNLIWSVFQFDVIPLEES